MNIQEFYDSIDESYENVSSRMMGNQKLVEKFVRKFLDDPTYEQIKEAVDKMDYDEILRTTNSYDERNCKQSGVYTFTAKKCESSRYDPCRTARRSIASDR